MAKKKQEVEVVEAVEVAIILNPEEFGLAKDKGLDINSMFMPSLVESNALAKVYEEVITMEISVESSKKAGDLRKKLVKVRTSIDRIHKAEKEFYLAGGRYVDALKNKATAPIKEMEITLSDIEKHFENEEKARIEALEKERITEVAEYGMDAEGMNLGAMSEEVWDAFLSGTKIKHEARIKEEAESERLEKEAKAKADIFRNRRDLLLPLSDFCDIKSLSEETTEEEFKDILDSAITLKNNRDKEIELDKSRRKIAAPFFEFQTEEEQDEDFGSISEEEFSSKLLSWEIKQSEAIAQGEKEKTHNERLEKIRPYLSYVPIDKRDDFSILTEDQFNQRFELSKKKFDADAKIEADRLAEADRLKEEKRIIDTRSIELQPYIVFIRDYNSLINSSEEDYQSQLSDIKKGAEDHWEAEKQKQASEAADLVAPDKDKMVRAIDMLGLPDIALSTEEAKEVWKEIESKFKGFSKWAKLQVSQFSKLD